MDPIYLDYAATTPLRPEVRAAMEPYLETHFGNPSSTHRWGRTAQAALEEARARVADALGAGRQEVVFVRGGTESDNLAILGRVDATRGRGETPVVVTGATEHKAVLDTARSVARHGGRAIILPVDRGGTLDLEQLERALAHAPCLVSLMWVNNEVGVIQPIAEVARRAAAHGVAVHTDAVQAVGKIPVHFADVRVACLSLSGHKIYGPRSAAALLVRRDTDLFPRLHGGGQEGGLRPGTPDVASAVGLAEAVTLAVAEQPALATRFAGLRDRLELRLREGIPGLRVHGAEAPRSPHLLSVGVPDVDPQVLSASLDLDGLAVSGGSACSSGSAQVSHVIAAMYGDDALPATVRFSFGRTTTDDDVERAAAITLRVVGRLQTAGVAL